MPSVSQKQHDFWVAIVHSEELAHTAEVSQEVAREFLAADLEAGLWQHKGDSSENNVAEGKTE